MIERRGPPSNLPLQLTSFVGRQEEIAEISRLLADARHLTLTGVGGAGKTRLSLEVAARVADGYPDGAWLVELAPLTDPGGVPAALASVLDVRETPGYDWRELLPEAIEDRTLLVVLDNCEHVVEAAAELAETLLRRCPGLRILATSRERLGTEGEVVWTVPPLRVPPAENTPGTLDALLEYEAARLFADRARAARPEQQLGDGDVEAIAAVCRQLDGIPLALELAGARMRAFGVQQIADRLDDRFRLLTAGGRTQLPRHQTLRGMVDWSYDMLSDPERRLLRRLSVFAGHWTTAAAEAVCAGDGIEAHAVLDLLAQLVEKSLVVADAAPRDARYRLLETIRQYGAEQLEAAGEREAYEDRHLRYFLAFVEDAVSRQHGPEGPAMLDRLDSVHDNLRVALDRAIEREELRDLALRLAGGLAWFWYLRGYHEEAARWLTRALDASAEPTAGRMIALHGAAWFAHHRFDSAQARTFLGESLAIARSLGDRWTESWVLHVLGRVAYFDHDPAGARALAEQSLAIAEEVGDEWLISYALHLIGIAAYLVGDYGLARTYYERALEIRVALFDREGTAILLQLLALVASRQGRLDEAEALMHEASTYAAVFGTWSHAMMIAQFTYVFAVRGEHERAVATAAAAVGLARRQRTQLIPLMEELMNDGIEMARAALEPERFEAAWEAGAARVPEDVLAELLGEGGPEEAAGDEREPAASALASLTPAESNVLRLLASGRTTREIAGELVVATSTVERHITHIYQKLGVRNRAEATAWALAHSET